MECPGCNKGFLTEKENLEQDRHEFSGFYVILKYTRFYKFCSNVKCNWKSIKRQLISETKFSKNITD